MTAALPSPAAPRRSHRHGAIAFPALPALVLASALAVTLPGPAALAQANPGCPGPVVQALNREAQRGAAEATVYVARTDWGISEPDSILDAGCIGSMLRYDGMQRHVTIDDMLSGMMQGFANRLCSEAQKLFGDAIGNMTGGGMYPQVPGGFIGQ